MTALAYYLLKVFLCSGILFFYYHVALKNKLFHQWNRFYLLFVVALSLALPLVHIKLLSHDENNIVYAVASADHYLQEITVKSVPSGISLGDLVIPVYVFVSLVLLGLFVFTLATISKILRSHTVQSLNNICFVNTAEPGTPFSFLRYIFWNQNIEIDSDAGRQIFRHELVHVQEKHTLDKLFLQVVLVVFWCNPVFWLIRRELRYIHEFIADQKAIGTDNTEAFAAMVLHTVFPGRYSTITNPFFQSSIKRRLFMLKKLKNPKMNYAGRILVLPVLAAVTVAFTLRAEERNTPNTDPGSSILDGQASADTTPKKVASIRAVDVNRTQDRVTFTYSDGSTETLTEKQAASRDLKLNGGRRQLIDSTGKPNPTPAISLRNLENPPLFVLDGAEVEKDMVESLNPNKIESINVLKGASAETKYGAKGKNGVVEIITKANLPGKRLPNENLTTIAVEGKPMMNGSIVSVDAGKGNNMKAELREVTVTGYRSPAEPVFEKSEFSPSVDENEWRQFLEKYSRSVVAEAGKTAKPGKYTVYVRFIVEKDGSLTNATLVNDPGHGIGPKVLEMMKHAPRWKPAIQNQKVVRSYHIQPITFVIADT